MLASVDDLQAHKFREVALSYILYLQSDTNSLCALIRGCVTSLPAHLFLITRASQINVMQFCCFSETSVDMFTALCNLLLLLIDNEKHHAIKLKIIMLMPVSPRVVVVSLSSLFVSISFCIRPFFTHFPLSFQCLSFNFRQAAVHWDMFKCPPTLIAF